MITSYLKVVIALGCLLVASYQDYKTREIEDYVWIVLGIIGGVLTGVELFLIGSITLVIVVIISFLIASGLGLILYKFGLVGGADTKALMTLGIVLPYYPLIDIKPIFPVYPTFVISIFENSVLLSASMVLYYFVKNLLLVMRGEKLFSDEISTIRKLILLLTCSKYDVYSTDWTKVFPIEFVDFSVNPPKKVYSFIHDVSVDVDAKSLIRGYEKGYLERRIWATAGLPMIIFFTLGLIVSLLLGDLVLATISALI